MCEWLCTYLQEPVYQQPHWNNTSITWQLDICTGHVSELIYTIHILTTSLINYFSILIIENRFSPSTEYGYFSRLKNKKPIKPFLGFSPNFPNFACLASVPQPASLLQRFTRVSFFQVFLFSFNSQFSILNMVFCWDRTSVYVR